MHKIIISTIALLSLIAVLITPGKTSEDILAERLASSETFKVIINFGKEIASHTISMPDSTKNKLKALKPRMDRIFHDESLTIAQRKDSILAIGKIIKRQNLFDSSVYKDAAKMFPVYKRLNEEFPEFKKMSREQRLSIFKKATLLLRRNLKA